ncbi:MAG: PTS 2-O-a-mannosyl-D-glycerate transporter subunit IIABC [Vibrionaceae bacterium]
MKLTSLTHPSLINLQTTFESRDAAIRTLAEQLHLQGKLHDKDQFLQAVFAREEQGPTALGEGIAVPHGKTDAVKEAAFAVATLKENLQWQGIDGDEDVNLIFLLAIPNSEAGSTHMQLLTHLTTTLVDDSVREAVLNATSTDELLALLDAPMPEETGAQACCVNADAPTIVCVTACPAGIAHTYMAAEYLEKTGKKLGINVHVEKQGANGIEDRLTAEQLNKADACVFAAEVAIKEVERFNGIPCVKVPVAEPIRHAERILQEAIEAGKNGAGAERAVATDAPTSRNSWKTDVKQALLSGISFAVPLIVAGGTVLAITVLLSRINPEMLALYNEADSWLNMYRKLGGGLLGTLMVPVLAAYIAYSLADKPALGPGFAAGLAANLIGAGFLGGVAGGLLAGYFMRWVKENVRVSPAFNGFLTFYLYPVLGTLVVGSLMLFVVGKPVAWLNQSLADFLNGLSGTNGIILGAVIGLFVSADLGGPINKAAYLFCVGAMANGNFVPYAIFASVKMVSAFTVTFSTMLRPRIFKDFEIETGKSTWLLGLAGITEGAIPMAIEDPMRVIGSFLVGSAVCGALVGAAGIGLQAPGAGIVSLFLLDHSPQIGAVGAGLIWFGAALVGTLISTIMLIAWRTHAVKNGHVDVQVAASN